MAAYICNSISKEAGQQDCEFKASLDTPPPRALSSQLTTLQAKGRGKQVETRFVARKSSKQEILASETQKGEE